MSMTGTQGAAFVKFNPAKNPNTVIAQRAPATTDLEHPDGTIWIDQVGAAAYIKIKSAANAADWNVIG